MNYSSLNRKVPAIITLASFLLAALCLRGPVALAQDRVTGPEPEAPGEPIGSVWTSEGHANWNILRSSVPNNPTELQVYPHVDVGKAHCANPGASGIVMRDGGRAFSAKWEGIPGFYLVQPGTVGRAREVRKVMSADSLELVGPCEGEGSTTYQFVSTTNSGTVRIDGARVERLSGQPFNVFAKAENAWKIDGIAHTCHDITENSAVCDTRSRVASAHYSSWANIDDEVTTLRLQKVYGTNEENLACSARAVGLYECRVQTTGAGLRWPWLLGNGEYAANHTKAFQLGLQTNGDLTLGGHYGRNSVLVPVVSGARFINPIRLMGGEDGGSSPDPVIAARSCGDACSARDVGMGIDTAGGGDVTFTNHFRASKGLVVAGTKGRDHVLIRVGEGMAGIEAAGESADINLTLSPSGREGVVAMKGVLQLPAYTVADLPSCDTRRQDTLAVVRDAHAPSYRGSLQGGGNERIPVFCDGKIWSAH